MDTPKGSPFELVSHRLGALPLVNHFLGRMGLSDLLVRWLPAPDRRFRLDPAVAIRLVVVNLLVGRAPLYGLGEWASPFAPGLLGLADTDAAWLNDDRVGRALEKLFHADRASLLTELIVGVVAEFGIDTSELHNDSTSVSVHGAYRGADGTPRGGKPTTAITFGHSKDHRPDLKQLVWILTVCADGAVPMAYRLADGNTSDDPTHIPTWDHLVALLGRADCLYVADSKLACGTAMRHIDAGGGRFATVLPRTRAEDKWFRDWAQTNQPQWTQAVRTPGTRAGEPDNVYRTFPAPLPSAEGYRIIWVHPSAKAARDAAARQGRIEAGAAAIDALAAKLASPKSRLRTRTAVDQAAATALADAGAARWITVTIGATVEETYRQERRGRPGTNTRYPQEHPHPVHHRLAAPNRCNRLRRGHRRLLPPHHQRHRPTRRRSAQRLPLPAQSRTPPPPAQERPGRRPALATRPRPHRSTLLLPVPRPAPRRAHRTPDPHRHAQRQHRTHPALPELRACPSPSAERILQIFADVTRHELHRNGRLVQTFEADLTPLQHQVLDLLGVPAASYTNPHPIR